MWYDIWMGHGEPKNKSGRGWGCSHLERWTTRCLPEGGSEIRSIGPQQEERSPENRTEKGRDQLSARKITDADRPINELTSQWR